MHIVAIASRKGGSGKSTLTGHLAVQAEQSGDGPVAVFDTDPQASLTQWWNARPSPTPRFVSSDLSNLQSHLDALRQNGIRVLFIDTPPALTETIHQVVSLADLVLIPTRPSPHDLRAIGGTMRLVEALGKPMVFVVNGATPRTRITAEAVSVLSRFGTLAPAIVHQRVDYAASMIDGRTVMELPGISRSAGEIAQLWWHLRDRLAGTAAPLRLPKAPPSDRLARVFPAVAAGGAA